MEEGAVHAELTKNSFEDIRAKLWKYPGGRVLLQKDENTGIATMFLDRQDYCNAMSGQMMVQFRECIESLERWNAGKGLILAGTGVNFCSGGDLKFAKAFSTPQDGLDMSIWMQDALVRLQKLPLISVCLVCGATIGGGAELSVFCDYIIAADNVKYGFVQGKMGLITAWGAGVRLVQTVGRAKAMDILLRAVVMNAQECVDIGLAAAVVPFQNSLEKTKEWITRRLCFPHPVTRAFKTIVSNAQLYSYEEALEMERDLFAPFWGGALNKEALQKNIKHS